MSNNEVLIHEFEIGKLHIDESKLSEDDKLNWLKTVNLLNCFIRDYRKRQKMALDFIEAVNDETQTISLITDLRECPKCGGSLVYDDFIKKIKCKNWQCGWIE